MNPQWQIWQVWVPPILALFGILIVVVITAWLNTRAVTSMIDAQRAELKQQMAGLELRLTKQITEFEMRLTNQILELCNWVARLEEQRGVVYTPGD